MPLNPRTSSQTASDLDLLWSLKSMRGISGIPRIIELIAALEKALIFDAFASNEASGFVLPPTKHQEPRTKNKNPSSPYFYEAEEEHYIWYAVSSHLRVPIRVSDPAEILWHRVEILNVQPIHRSSLAQQIAAALTPEDFATLLSDIPLEHWLYTALRIAECQLIAAQAAAAN